MLKMSRWEGASKPHPVIIASDQPSQDSKASIILQPSTEITPLLPISQHPFHQSQTPALLPPTITASALASALASPSSTFLITMIPVIFTKNSNARPMVANSGVLHTSLPSTSQEIMPCQTWAVLLKAVPIVKPRRRG